MFAAPAPKSSTASVMPRRGLSAHVRAHRRADHGHPRREPALRYRTRGARPSRPVGLTARGAGAAEASAGGTREVGACLRHEGERQLDDEDRAASALRGHGDPSSHSVDELAADVEAETRAADAVLVLRIEAVELVEDP